MKDKLLFACFILGLLFNCSVFATNAPVIKIFIKNPKSIPFVFFYTKYYGNVCVSQSSDLVACIINNNHVSPGFVLNLQWVNPNKTSCWMNLLLMGDKINYSFLLSSTIAGSSFSPQQWDGKSNLNATLVVGSGGC